MSNSATPWTVAHQFPPSTEFSRQEYWSGLPFPSPGDLPNPGIKPRYPALWADALLSEPPGNPEFQGQVQTVANQGKGEDAETREGQSRNNGAALGAGLSCPSRDHKTISLSCFADTETPTKWKDVNV